jgi:hypothetical protein
VVNANEFTKQLIAFPRTRYIPMVLIFIDGCFTEILPRTSFARNTPPAAITQAKKCDLILEGETFRWKQ